MSVDLNSPAANEIFNELAVRRIYVPSVEDHILRYARSPIRLMGQSHRVCPCGTCYCRRLHVIKLLKDRKIVS